jgi:nitrite reductase/ring-hydroxylating ferredoxin subunit
MDGHDRQQVPPLTRRCTLHAACAGAAALIAGCAGYGAGGGGAGPVAPPAPPPGSGVAPLATTADIPVGGGTVFSDQQIVIAQPTAGDIRAFSAVCTHQGCVVTEVAGGTINCQCHGSKYYLDGSVAEGPAPTSLPPARVSVQGQDIVQA